ncbi:hypothetical protein [Paenibacillus prosopidis]|uniref:Acetyltransferase (GNAT) family protein n=1 Tax=Paenibacillus prosopidis TaxID=630520 RepID=A0A368VGC6_9BACL|nr:hypothetical protein [Paenibacillus prosopidis]RCW40327.1 hypothetical protein DFP97_1364 [Paenibacillus prosopidis]
MSINYRDAIYKDEEEMFVLAAKLATSFKLSRTDFSRTYQEVLSSKDVDLFVAENESGIIGYV